MERGRGGAENAGFELWNLKRGQEREAAAAELDLLEGNICMRRAGH